MDIISTSSQIRARFNVTYNHEAKPSYGIAGARWSVHRKPGR